MKQTRTPSAWYAGIVAQARTQTETLMRQFEDLPAPAKPQDIERTAKAILAVVKLAEFADRLSGGATEDEPPVTAVSPQPERPMNRHERRRLEALGKSAVQSPPKGVTIPTNTTG